MRNCYYTYGRGCPGLMAAGNRHVQKRCRICEHFNGNLGTFTTGKQDIQKRK